MTDEEGAAFLANNGWLTRISADFRSELLSKLVWRRFEAGAVVTFAGEDGGLFGLADGQLAITSGINAPDSPMSDLMMPGSWLGVAPLYGYARFAESRAISPCLTGVIPLSVQRRLLSQNPAWWQDMGQLLIDFSLRYGTGIPDLLIPNSHRRCLAVLLRFAGLRFAGDEQKTILISQDKLAASSNLSRHLAGQALREASRRGLLSVGYREVTILDPGNLRAFVNGD